MGHNFGLKSERQCSGDNTSTTVQCWICRILLAASSCFRLWQSIIYREVKNNPVTIQAPQHWIRRIRAASVCFRLSKTIHLPAWQFILHSELAAAVRNGVKIWMARPTLTKLLCTQHFTLHTVEEEQKCATYKNVCRTAPAKIIWSQCITMHTSTSTLPTLHCTS